MAKKNKKKDKTGSDAAEAVEAVRSAIERTFQATSEGAAGTQKRTRALVDEVAHAAARIRETIEDLRVLEDVRGLRRRDPGAHQPRRRARGPRRRGVAALTPCAREGVEPAGQARHREVFPPAEGQARRPREVVRPVEGQAPTTAKSPAQTKPKPATAARSKAKSSPRAKAARAKPAQGS